MASHILHLRIKVPNTKDELFSFLRDAIPYYESPGGVRVRLLRSLENPTRFVEIVEYDSREAFDNDQRRVTEDPRMRSYLQAWRSLLVGDVQVESYEDVTDQL